MMYVELTIGGHTAYGEAELEADTGHIIMPVHIEVSGMLDVALIGRGWTLYRQEPDYGCGASVAIYRQMTFEEWAGMPRQARADFGLVADQIDADLAGF